MFISRPRPMELDNKHLCSYLMLSILISLISIFVSGFSKQSMAALCNKLLKDRSEFFFGRISQEQLCSSDLSCTQMYISKDYFEGTINDL